MTFEAVLLRFLTVLKAPVESICNLVDNINFVLACKLVHNAPCHEYDFFRTPLLPAARLMTLFRSIPFADTSFGYTAHLRLLYDLTVIWPLQTPLRGTSFLVPRGPVK